MSDHPAAVRQAIEPVAPEPASPSLDDEPASPGPHDGVGLCLSGGGYRAMLFHAGALLRLNQLRYLAKLTRISSVSGGSIISAKLGMHWDDLTWDDGRATDLVSKVVQPIIEMSKHTIDVSSVAVGLVTPFRSIGDEVARHYKHHLFHDATLQDLPDDTTAGNPRFVINSTSLQTGKLVRFSRPYIGDYRVGQWLAPTTSLAEAVTASSAFPPVLSPYKLKPTGNFVPSAYPDTNGAEFSNELVLTDGGVYDNLGLQTVWPSCKTVLVSDGGMPLWPESDPHGDWLRESIRVTEVIDSQVRALRKRQTIAAFVAERNNPVPWGRHGTYWGIASDTASFPISDPLPFIHASRDYPSNIATRLAKVDDTQRADLLHWGYVICDTAMRSWVIGPTDPPDADDLPSALGL
jgi:NTE family protein